MLALGLFFTYIRLIRGEEYEAFYIPEDKLAKYPNHPNFTSNKEIYYGLTLKDRLFKDEEYEKVNIAL